MTFSCGLRQVPSGAGFPKLDGKFLLRLFFGIPIMTFLVLGSLAALPITQLRSSTETKEKTDGF